MKKLYILLFIATQSLYGQVTETDPLPDTLIEKAFLVADANGDGVLTKKEFTVFINKAKKARRPKVVQEKELSPE
jgi:hypothetical protein